MAPSTSTAGGGGSASAQGRARNRSRSGRKKTREAKKAKKLARKTVLIAELCQLDPAFAAFYAKVEGQAESQEEVDCEGARLHLVWRSFAPQSSSACRQDRGQNLEGGSEEAWRRCSFSSSLLQPITAANR